MISGTSLRVFVGIEASPKELYQQRLGINQQMILWSERQAELANLLNPAFCGFLLREAISSYLIEAESPMPLSLSFLILPLVLHAPTRKAFPYGVSTTFLSWIQSNPEIRIGLVSRIQSINPFTRESLQFLFIRELLTIDGGALRIGTGTLNNTRGLQNKITSATEEAADCVKKAKFLGRWLALAPDEVTIYNFMGIQP